MAISVKYVAAFALLALLLVPLAAAATVDVTIHVVDKDGGELKDADVTLYNSTDDEICSDTTNKHGEASCDGVLVGDDTSIVVELDDYQKIDDSKTLKDYDKDWKDVAVVLEPNDNFDLDITVVDQNGDNVRSADVTLESDENNLDDGDFDSSFDLVVFPSERSRYEAFDYSDSDTTDSDGIVTFSDLEFNTDYTITVKKSGYPNTVEGYSFPNKARDEETEVEITAPGTAQLTATVTDKETSNAISGATVKVVRRDNLEEKVKTTDSKGQAIFTLDTPAYYDIQVTAPNYGSDQVTNEFFGNDNDKKIPFMLTSENKPPIADAGEDQYVLVGGGVTLNATGSSDPDNDTLTYSWVDSLGTAIQDGPTPEVVFDTAGDHVLTLTVSDGTATSTDEVTVFVGSPEECGDAICTLVEGETGSCPEDCPVCEDEICGAGEASSESTLYCPIDCSIKTTLVLENATPLVPGNSTTLVAADPNTGNPILGSSIEIETPNGSVSTLETIGGRTDYTFVKEGKYKIKVISDDYLPSTTEVEIKSSGMDLSWLAWVLVIVVIIVALLFVVRFMNMKGGGSKGYRANKYRRGKPTLSQV